MTFNAAITGGTDVDPPELGDATTITLPAKLDFTYARKLHGELMAVREAPSVVLDASGVEQTSTAAVLVIVSFLNARAGITPPAAVLNPPGAFIDPFSELGFFGTLMRMEFRS